MFFFRLARNLRARYGKRGRHGAQKTSLKNPPLSAARKATYLLFIALTFLFFRGMGDHGLLDPIEGVNASVALNMVMSGNLSTPMVDGGAYLGNSMGFWWLSALSLSIFGWSEFSMRLWPVIGGLGMAAAGWFMAMRLSGERAANYSAVLIGSSVLVYTASQLASPHALYAFFVTLSLTGTIYAFRNKRFFILTHVSAVLAFVVYGPAGIMLPWLSILAYAILSRQERFFAKALLYWPGLLATIFMGGGYVIFLRSSNPHILTLMSGNIPGEVFYSAASVFHFLAAGFILWLGALPGAIKNALALRLAPAEKSEGKGGNHGFLLLVWSAVFLLFGAFSRDALLLTASVPAMAMLCAIYLSNAVDENNISLFRRFVAIQILLLGTFIFIGLPWFFTTDGSEFRYTLMSVIPWAIFALLFIGAGWKYARARQLRKSMLFMSIFSLLSLMPLAGVFDLLAENRSVRGSGVYLRNEMAHGDVLIQYALNHPSLFFYARRPNQASLLIHTPVNQRIVGQGVINEATLNNMWLARTGNRVFVMVRRGQSARSIPSYGINFMHEAHGMIVLSNRPDHWMMD